jgi:putative membrane protein
MGTAVPGHRYPARMDSEQERVPADAEPDYRFTLANERTFLAWIRTALGLLAGGVAVRQVVPPFAVPGATAVLGLMCISLAVVLAATSYPRWRAVQRAMRAGEPLPPSRVMLAVTVGVVLVAVTAGVLVITG